MSIQAGATAPFLVVEGDQIVRLSIELGALKQAPVYERHKRGKNWAAIVAKDPTAPGGLARKFLTGAKGEYFYMVSGDVVPGAVIEFGADYYTTSGSKRAERWYGVVVSVSDSELVLIHAEDKAQAFVIAARPQLEQEATQAEGVTEISILPATGIGGWRVAVTKSFAAEHGGGTQGFVEMAETLEGALELARRMTVAGGAQ
jgi:hypothetical protein